MGPRTTRRTTRLSPAERVRRSHATTLKPRSATPQEKKQVVAALRRVASAAAAYPDEQRYVSMATYHQLRGSDEPTAAFIAGTIGWRRALELAGLRNRNTPPRAPALSHATCRAAVRTAAAHLGISADQVLSRDRYERLTRENRELSLPHFSHIQRSYGGSFAQGVADAGLTPGRLEYSEDAAIASLIAVAQHLGHEPSVEEFRDAPAELVLRSPSVSRILKAEGEWRQALDRAKLRALETGQDWPPPREKKSARKRVYYTPEAAFSAVTAVTRHLGRVPTRREYDRLAPELVDAAPASGVIGRREPWASITQRAEAAITSSAR